MAANQMKILLAEDDDMDAEILCRQINRLQLANPIVRVHDGLEALKALRDSTGTQERFLVLLDMNMPRMNGVEFLDEYRFAPDLHHHIILVLSNLEENRFLLDSYGSLIRGHLAKGEFPERFVEELSRLQL